MCAGAPLLSTGREPPRNPSARYSEAVIGAGGRGAKTGLSRRETIFIETRLLRRRGPSARLQAFVDYVSLDFEGQIIGQQSDGNLPTTARPERADKEGRSLRPRRPLGLLP
jgi:hypothetical protein